MKFQNFRDKEKIPKASRKKEIGPTQRCQGIRMTSEQQYWNLKHKEIKAFQQPRKRKMIYN